MDNTPLLIGLLVDNTPLLVGLIAAGAVVLGWLATSYQRVNEKVGEERRAAFNALLDAAEEKSSASDDGAFRRATIAATLVCSKRMIERVDVLRKCVESEQCLPEEERVRFMNAARLEGLSNSMWMRLFQRNLYEGAPRCPLCFKFGSDHVKVQSRESADVVSGGPPR